MKFTGMILAKITDIMLYFYCNSAHYDGINKKQNVNKLYLSHKLYKIVFYLLRIMPLIRITKNCFPLTSLSTFTITSAARLPVSVLISCNSEHYRYTLYSL